MNIIISNNSDDPLYKQIKDQIKEAILKNELIEGDALPSIRNFASEINVSVLTIRRVYQELEDEGFVKRQAGVGTFVSSGNLDLIKDAKYRTVEEQLKGVVTEAKMLNISIEDLRAMLDILYEDDVYD